MVRDVVGPEVLLDDADDVRRDVRQALAAVRGIVVVGRDGPEPVTVGHLERDGGRSRLVELHHLERRRGFGIGELREERFPDVEEGVGHGPTGRTHEGHDGQHDGRAAQGQGFSELVHHHSLNRCAAAAPSRSRRWRRTKTQAPRDHHRHRR